MAGAGAGGGEAGRRWNSSMVRAVVTASKGAGAARGGPMAGVRAGQRKRSFELAALVVAHVALPGFMARVQTLVATYLPSAIPDDVARHQEAVA